MRKGIRVFAAVSLLVTLFSASTAFAGPRDSQNVNLFERFLAWVTNGWWSPPIDTPSPNSHWSPPIGAPQPNGLISPPIGAPSPDPDPETQGHLSPPSGAPDTLPPATTT